MIRRMCENDIPQIAELERKYFSVPWSAKSLKQSLKRPEYLFLVVEKEGEAVGYGGFFRVLEEGNITNIVIDERYRGKGLGKALVRALLEEGGILASLRLLWRYGPAMRRLSVYISSLALYRKAYGSVFMRNLWRMP